MDRDQRKAFVLIGGFALVLVGAFLFFGWRGLFGHSGRPGRRQAFAEASPTPKANARQASESEGEIATVGGSKLEGSLGGPIRYAAARVSTEKGELSDGSFLHSCATGELSQSDRRS
jgi:hypothetical protein